MIVVDRPAEPRASGLTDRWYPLRAHAVQSAAWRSRSRFLCLPCGRQSGKSELAKRKLVRSLPIFRGHRDVHRYAYLAPTGPQAKRIAWNDLKQLVPRHWMLGLPRETDLVIRCRFSTHIAELWVIGMDRPQRFEGPGWDGVVSDESSDQKQNLELSVRPAIDSRGGWWWLIGVPKRQGIGARVYREFCERGIRGEGGWETYSWPSWDILPAAVIEQARRDMDERDFLEQYGAAWQTTGGAAFYQFDTRVHVRQVPYNPLRPILVASDFNVDPMAWCLCQLANEGRGLGVFDELWLRDANTQQALDVLWDRYGENHQGGWEFYGDATGQARKTSAAASDYAQIKNDRRFAGRVRYPRSNPGVKDRLSSCNAIFRSAAGEVRCWIDPQCTHLIADLMNRGLDRHGMPTEADKFGGHITDAFGYLVHARWPATRIEPQGEAAIGVYYGD